MKAFVMACLTGVMILAMGCTGPQGAPGPQGPQGNTLIATVYDFKNINFTFTTNQGYIFYSTFSPYIYPSDNVIMYRMVGTVNPTTPIWQQIPRTLYLNNGQELDYDFDFTQQDFTIYAGGNYDVSTTPQYLTNQTFRVVVVPGGFLNKKALNYSDCAALMRALGLGEQDVKTLH